jgi:hypothetical protein
VNTPPPPLKKHTHTARGWGGSLFDGLFDSLAFGLKIATLPNCVRSSQIFFLMFFVLFLTSYSSHRAELGLTLARYKGLACSHAPTQLRIFFLRVKRNFLCMYSCELHRTHASFISCFLASPHVPTPASYYTITVYANISLIHYLLYYNVSNIILCTNICLIQYVLYYNATHILLYFNITSPCTNSASRTLLHERTQCASSASLTINLVFSGRVHGVHYDALKPS